MKKIIAILLTMILILSCTACGKSKDTVNDSQKADTAKTENDTKNDSPDDSTKESTPKDKEETTNNNATVQNNPTAQNNPTVQKENNDNNKLSPENTNPAPSQEKDAQDNELIASPGRVSGNLYESNFLGIGFHLPSGWSFSTEDEIKELNQISLGLQGEEYANAIASADAFYDMYAYHSLGSNVSITVERLNEDEMAHTEASIANEAIEPIKEIFTQMGFTNITANVSTTTFAGATHSLISMTVTGQGVTMYEKVVIIKLGQYMANFTVATPGTDTTTSVLNQFFKLN